MRPIDLNNVKQTEPGSFKAIEPGVYPVIIQKVEDHPKAEYLTLELDIIAGDYEGFFSTPYYADKPYAHAITLFYSERSEGEFAWSMGRIGESNTGFDVAAAIGAGNYQMLEGKVCGCIFAQAEFFNKKTEEFEIGSNAQPKKLCSTADIKSGKYKDETTPIMLSKNRKLGQIKNKLDLSDKDAERWLNAYEARKECKENVPNIPPASSTPAGVYDGDIPFM